MKILGFPFLVIPGVGHIHYDRPWKGIFLFCCFIGCLNGTLLAHLLLTGSERSSVMLAGLVCAATVWLYTMADIFALSDGKAREHG